MSFALTTWRAIAGLSIAAAIALAVSAAPRSALAQGSVTPPPMRLSPLPSPSIAPSATPTLPPASASLKIPYPAYGTPAPSVTASYVDGTVPQTITLRQAILIGIARSPALAQARAAVQLAKANVNVQRVAILPNVAAQGSATHSRRQLGGTSSSVAATPAPAATTAPPVVSPDLESNAVSLQLRQLIFDGGKTYSTIKSATTSEIAQIDTYQRQLQTVAFNVATAYYNALAAERTTAVDQETVNQDIVQENLVRAQYSAGQASQVDVITAQLPTAQARLALVQQQGVEIADQAALANAMGLDANTVVRPADDASNYEDIVANTLAIPTYDRAIQQAYLLRPDLQAAQKSVEAAQYTVKSAKLGRVPSISGTAVEETASSDSGGGAYRNVWSVQAALTIPIYDAGQTSALVAQAQANVDSALASYNTAKLGVQLNVKQALTALISARSALDAAQAAYVNAATVLSATQAQYRAGVTTLPLLLNAQVGLTTALTSQVNAIYTLRQAEQSFLYALGQNA